MGKVKLVVRRHYIQHEFYFDSIDDAVEEALAQLDNDQSFPDYIEIGNIRIWEQSGPFEIRESLQKLASDDRFRLKK